MFCSGKIQIFGCRHYLKISLKTIIFYISLDVEIQLSL